MAKTSLSEMNIFSPSSTSSLELVTSGRNASEMHHQRIIYEIVDQIFMDQTGICEISSSHCSSVVERPSRYHLDKRLKYWKDMVEERKLLSDKVSKVTGKEKVDVLFNRTVTIDDRDKEQVKRVIDCAERLNPINVMTKKQLRLPEYIDCEKCAYVPELQETLKKTDRDGEGFVEIIGLPKAMREEQLGKEIEQGSERKSHWLRSKVLGEHIEKNYEDIERVVEFYPDIDKLQVIGESMIKDKLKHDSDIELMEKLNIKDVSSDGGLVNECNAEVKMAPAEEEADYVLKVNDQVYKRLQRRSAKHVDMRACFICEPFEKIVKRVLRLQNLGKKPLTFEFIHRPFYEKSARLFKATDEEFLFEHKSFRLFTGEDHEIVVQFQPRKVGIFKSKWIIKIDTPFFCRNSDSIVLELLGKCKPSQEYIDKVADTQRLVIAKSNLTVMQKVTRDVGDITPLLKPPDCICPFKRNLYEREIFEALNPGYMCERLHDLELLKDLYKRLKKPRERLWDFKIETLREFVLRLESVDDRALYFAEMMGIIEGMKGLPKKIDEYLYKNEERDRTCHMYVKGLICTSFDDWEQLLFVIEDAFYKPELKEYYSKLVSELVDEIGEEEADELPDFELRVQEMMLYTDEEEIKPIVLKNMKRLKPFRDSLYLQTYTLLCNMMEDVVSVIESTEVI